MDGLAQSGKCQGERLIYNDPETGTEVWRLTFDPSMNFTHAHINRSPWNSNGSALVFQSNRGMPGQWKDPASGMGDPHFFSMPADGSSFDFMKVLVQEGQDWPELTGRFVIWDRLNPVRSYWATYAALYAIDLTPTGPVASKVVDLPNTDRRKDIFSYASEDNVLMIKDFNSTAYDGELYFLDLKKKSTDDGFLWHYSWKLGITYTGHAASMETGLHDVYFRRTPSSSYIFNYGSATDVGEYLFFEAPAHVGAAPIRLCYSDADPEIPYYSHPAWSPDGSMVTYFGLERAGADELNPGWHVRINDQKKDVACLIPGWVGGHTAWDGYDPNWVFAAIESAEWAPDWDGWLVHAYIPDGHATKLMRHKSQLNGGPSSYAALPRPAQSPDATKCLFHSTMSHLDDQTMDLYVAVSHHPAAPASVTVRVETAALQQALVSWAPPPQHREIRGYHVYRAEGESTDFLEITSHAVPATALIDTNRKPDKTYSYFVTSEEYSGLESDRSSPIARLDASGYASKPGGSTTAGWDRVAPPSPIGLTASWNASNRVALAWGGTTAADTRLYNVYYSTTGAPGISQATRIASPGALATSYIDWAPDPAAASHYYAVTAADRAGNESSPVFVTITR